MLTHGLLDESSSVVDEMFHTVTFRHQKAEGKRLSLLIFNVLPQTKSILGGYCSQSSDTLEVRLGSHVNNVVLVRYKSKEGPDIEMV